MHHTSVGFNNKMWIIGGYNKKDGSGVFHFFEYDVWYSPDGIEWTRILDSAPWGRRENTAV